MNNKIININNKVCYEGLAIAVYFVQVYRISIVSVLSSFTQYFADSLNTKAKKK